MCAEYVAGRKECVRLAMSHAAAFSFKDEVLHDAVLLLDRTMCSGTPLPPAMLPLLVAACILISARQGLTSAHLRLTFSIALHRLTTHQL